MVKTLARNARNPGSIPGGGKFQLSPDLSERYINLSVCTEKGEILVTRELLIAYIRIYSQAL